MENVTKEISDKELALAVRNAIEHLHRTIRVARDAGLTITFESNIQHIGLPMFAYRDSVRIIRFRSIDFE